MDLDAEMHTEGEDDYADDEEREQRLKGRWGWAWRIWEIFA